MNYLEPYIPEIIGVCTLAVTTLVSWLITFYVKPYLGAKTSAELIEVLDKAITSGFYLAQKQGYKVGTKAFLTHVTAYVRQSIPDTIARISPLPDALDRKITATIIKIASTQIEEYIDNLGSQDAGRRVPASEVTGR